jgi:photosystem II stability/assembly factor-like uncharacterized protein
VADQSELERLYREAQSALKSRDYVRASGLLRQVLVIDENYKDVSHLLAQTVKLKRRHWYNHPILWGALGFLMIVAFGFFITPHLRELHTVQPTQSVIIDSPTVTLAPPISPTATAMHPPTPTPIPLTWKRVSIGQEFERDTVTAFVVDPKDRDVLYAGLKNAGIYKTIDGGLSWRPAHHGLSNTHVQSLSINPQNPQSLYAGTMGGIFQTEDGGESWSIISKRTYLLMDLQDGSHLYSRDSDGIYESTDGGKNWKSVYSSKIECPGEILGWAIHPTDGNTLFVGGGEKCEPGVYLSSDRGHTWTLLAKREIRPGGYTIHDMGLDNLTIGLDRQDNFYIRMNAGVSSFEGGVKHNENGYWKTILELDDKPIVFDAAGSVYFHCDTHLCKFNLDDSQRVTLGMPDVGVFTSITILPDDPKIIYVTGTGTSVSKDGGVTWTKLNNGLGSTMLQLNTGFGDAETLYLFSGNCIDTDLQNRGNMWSENTQPLYISTNGGSAWDFSVQAGCYLIQDANGITLYRISYLHNPHKESLLRSQDGGKSWRGISVPPFFAYTFTTDSVQSGLLYLNGLGDFYNQYVSKDYGDHWVAIEPPEDIKPCHGFTMQFIDRYRPMTIDPFDGNHVFVIDGGTLLESHDSCDTIEAFATPPNTSMNSIAFNHGSPDILYAGTDSGAHISFDSGNTWNQINDGLLGAIVVYSIVVDKDSHVYAATPYGIFKLEEK